jgi:flagellar basal-body rod protein FlgG
MSLQALYSAASGMDAQQVRIDNIANNLANVNTVGYKASRDSFEDLMYDQIQTPGVKNGANTVAPVGAQVGHGTKLSGVYKQFSQGEVAQTNRQLDVAIEGNGFLQLTLEDGQKAYTRDGALTLDSTGRIVTKQGLVIDPSITVPPDATNLTIGRDGTISVNIAGQSAAQDLGKIQLAMFQNPAGLKSIGQNFYQETNASGAATVVDAGLSGAGTLSQGVLENSNVNVAEELIGMIVAQRMYEANSKVMSTTSEMMKSSNSVF